MKTINISLQNTESYIINDTKENFKHSKAFKYLECYNQIDTRNYNSLFDNVDMYSESEIEEIENFHIVEISANGYSQNEYQEWFLYFDKTILKDSEAMEELKYFTLDMKYYFTETGICAFWEIETIKIIDGKEFINKDDFDWCLSTSFIESPDNEEIKDFIINDFIPVEWYNSKDYSININYNIKY